MKNNRLLLMLMLVFGIGSLSYAAEDGLQKPQDSGKKSHPVYRSIAKYLANSILPKNRIAKAALLTIWKYKKPLAVTAGWNVVLSTGLYGASWVPLSETAFNTIKDRIPFVKNFSNKQIRIFIRVLPLVMYILIELKNKVQEARTIKPVLPLTNETTNNTTTTITTETTHTEGDLVTGGKQETVIQGDQVAQQQINYNGGIFAGVNNSEVAAVMMDKLLAHPFGLAILTGQMMGQQGQAFVPRALTFDASAAQVQDAVLAIPLPQEVTSQRTSPRISPVQEQVELPQEATGTSRQNTVITSGPLEELKPVQAKSSWVAIDLLKDYFFGGGDDAKKVDHDNYEEQQDSSDEDN